MRICTIENCNRKYVAKGYCNTHYSNFKRKGDPLPREISVGCRVSGCNKKHYSKGYCHTHYRHLSWDTNAYQRRLGTGKLYYAGVCKASDCERGIYAKGYCRMHYMRIKREGTVELFHARRFSSLPAKANSLHVLLTKDLIAVAFTKTTLTGRERKIIVKRFWKNLTLAETAVIFHLTRERIRQIEAVAIKKMKKFIKKDMASKGVLIIC